MEYRTLIEITGPPEQSEGGKPEGRPRAERALGAWGWGPTRIE
jgi:hypothetical protein